MTGPTWNLSYACITNPYSISEDKEWMTSERLYKKLTEINADAYTHWKSETHMEELKEGMREMKGTTTL